ncbi:helix-turn-helix domain-containing protein [Alkalicoccobacillus gibsonii]|uniref:Helix-turn-helix domain-containing protein n=1 Tax=Alkalicoccobacillus gibsonii TaxID=79881 RepID=A0ABU9VMY5_9BACI
MYKALLIDPEILLKDKLVNALDWNEHGFQLHTFSESFSKAFVRFKIKKYDVVFLHLVDDNPKGLEICKRIRKVSKIPLLLFGGSKDFHFIRQTIRLQVTDYLLTPLHSDELENCLLTLKQTLKTEIMPLHQPLKTKITSQKNRKTIIEEVKMYAHSSLNTNITLKEISDDLHYNCSYLGQKFKAQEQMTFYQYLLTIRMDKAKSLLASTDLKIYEVASEVGYTDLDWFYKKFKEHVGESASNYRRRYQSISSVSANTRYG